MRTAKLPPAFVVGATNLTVSALTLFPVRPGHWQIFLSVFFLGGCSSVLIVFRFARKASLPTSPSFSVNNRLTKAQNHDSVVNAQRWKRRI